MTATLSLYHLRTCPFCLKVRRAAAELGIELELIDIAADPAARRRLLDARGRTTVPVLSIPSEDGETLLPESDDIVAYLRRHVATLRSTAA
ncbi:MAG: glutathione S-transferase N-terminal domain-containing protein [Myxococcota bacterium]